MRATLWGLGFLLGLIVAVAVEGLLIFLIDGASGREMMPRGLGWIVIPVMAAFAGARVLPVLVDRALAKSPALATAVNDRHKRFMIVGAGGWAVAFVLYWLVAQPYDYAMRGDDWWRFLEMLFLPILLYLGVYFGALWAASAPRR